ncbi:MAG: hypothetical protein O7H40_06890 [Gammaproteobacteria bacterium]|nr:hypothetical protein [Gammaproteobacteria bacterium]
MGLRKTCGRCVAVCYERNPVIAKMLGLCPLLAITDTVMDGVIFGGFFTCVLCFAGVAVPPLRYLLVTSLRPLLYQLALSIIVAAVGAWLISKYYEMVAPYGVYLALIAANCLILDSVEHRRTSVSLSAATLELLIEGAFIWISLVMFGAIREILASGTLLLDVAATTVGAVPSLGTMPIAGSSAGALILLGLIAAGINAARRSEPAGGQIMSPLAEADPAP